MLNRGPCVFITGTPTLIPAGLPLHGTEQPPPHVPSSKGHALQILKLSVDTALFPLMPDCNFC